MFTPALTTATRIICCTTLLCTLLALSASLGCESVREIVSGMDKPGASVSGVRVERLSMEGATLTFDLDVTNPYDVPLPLTAVGYSLASGGESFLTGTAPLSGAVPARGMRTISLPAEVTFTDLLAAVSGVRPGAIVPYEAALDLSVDVPGAGDLTLPLTASGHVPVPAPPTVSIERMNFDEISLNRAAAIVRLNVTNPNQFDLNLERIGYTLALGGEEVSRSTLAHAARLRRNGGSGMIEIPLEFSPMRFGTAMLNLLRGSDAAYAIDGDFDVSTPYGPLSLPFESAGRALLGQ